MKRLLAAATLLIAGAVAGSPVASAAIAQRGSSTTGTTTNTSLTITKPTGVVAGDVMIVNIAQVGNNTTNPSLSGWTLIAGTSLAGGTARYAAVLYRVADGTEGSSFTFTLGSGVTGASGGIVAFSGVASSVFDVAPGAISVQPNQSTVNATSITTADANAAVIMFGEAANSNPTWSGWTTTSPGALTQLYSNAANNASVGAAWAIKATAGATGTGTATLSSSERNGGILIALKPFTVAAPSITKAFAPSSMPVNGTSTLTLTITNANAATMTGVAVSDPFPSGVQVASTPAFTNTCGGTVTGNTAGSTTLSLTGGSINASSSCAININVTATTSGSKVNTTGAVSSTNDGTGGTASATLAVEIPPTISKAFAPTSVTINTSSTLTITITNPAANTVALTGLAVTDTFPSGLVVSTPNGASNTCGGTFTATAGSGSVSLSGGTVAAASSCTLVANLTSATASTYNNTTGTVSATNGGTGGTASATLTVTTPPTITKGFAPSTIAVGGTSTLTLNITNPSATQTQTGLAVSDTFPSGVQVAATPNLTNTCGGSVTGATSGSTSISLSGGSLAVSASCAVSVSVTGTTGGAKANTTGNISSTNGGTGGTASATLTVVAPPTITKAFGSSATGIPVNGTSTMTITITNPAANTVALTGVTVSDTFPGGMSVVTSALTTTCSGGLTGGGVGTSTFSLNASTIATGGSCTITGSVTDNTAGVATNTTGNVSSTNGGTGLTASANLPVNSPPTVTKTFAPTSVATGASSQLTITITNPDTVSLTGVTISDTFPNFLVVQTPPGSSVSGCFTGTLTANAGAGSISLSSSSVAVGTPCVIQVNVTSATVGTYTNTTGAVNSTNAGTGGTASATLTVTAPPTITKSFNPTSIPLNGTSTITLTITNPATNTGAMNGIAVSDTFPSGMTVATPPNASTTCAGGTVIANAGAGSISLAGGSIATPGTTCTVNVDVTSTTAGARNNTTGNVSSTNDGTGTTASATLTVVAPPTITKAFGSSASGIPVNGTSTMTITITNPAANTVALTGVTVSDTFPGGMSVVTSALTTTCSGGLTGGGVGTSTFSLNASTIATGGSCTITGSVTDNTVGVATNTTGTVSSTNGGTGLTASANLPVNSPPTVTKTFAPTSVAISVSSQLTITITNPDTVTVTGVTISDTFPTGLVVQTPNGASTSGCTGGALTATAGSGSISLSASSVAVGTPCIIHVNVTSATVGTYINTTNAVNSTNGGTGLTASATLTVTAAPTITKSFNPTSIPLNGTSTLTLTITNPATNTGAMNGIAVSDTFPSGVQVAATPNAGNTCGGTFSPAAGNTTISLTNGTISTPGATCEVNVNVTATTTGSKTNTTGAVSSTNDGTGGTASATLTVFGAATKLVYTQQPTNTAAGSPITPAITVAVEDANSLVVTNSSASIAIAITTNPGGGTLSGTTPVNAVNGVATFSDLSINKTGTGYRLTASSAGLTSAQSNTFNITPGAATQLVFTTEPSATASGGTAFAQQPTVTVEDASGNTITTGAGSTASISLAITSGTGTAGAVLTCTTNPRAAVAGVDTFAGCNINLAGTGYTLTATSAGLTSAVSTTINVNVGAAAKLAFGVQPSDTQFSTAITPAVTVLVEDAGGNMVNSSASITMTIGTNPSGGTLSGTLTVPAVNGTATFSNLSINKSGVGYTLHAAATGLTAATSSTFNILAGPPTQLVFGVQPSNTMAGAPIAPAITVQVEDAAGNVELSGTGSNASVSIAIGTNPSSGVLSGTTMVNAVAGVATFSTLSIAAQGSGYTLVASSTGLASATSNSFNITAPQVTYIQPFNTGHGWTYTQTSCAVGLIGSCSNSAAATGANCASSPCVDVGVFAGIQTGASQSGYFNSPVGSYTWQTLGIPPNSTVVSVQGGWSDEAVGTIGACATGTTAGIQIFDVGNTIEITSSDVVPLVQVGGNTSITVHNLGPAVNVLNGFQATSTGITLRFNLAVDSASFLGDCTLYGDTFELLISYTVGSPAGGRRGQVIVVWNRQPDGTMSQAWAYNVELSGDSAEPLTLADLKLVSSGRSGFVLDSSALVGKGRRVTKQATE